MDVNTIFVPKNVASGFDRLFAMSSILDKEIGGILCHDDRGKSMMLKDIVQVNGSLLRKSSYSYSTDAVTMASRFQCMNEMPVIFHTHPSGNPVPSIQDRLASDESGMIGCIISGSRVTCYNGQENLKVAFL